MSGSRNIDYLAGYSAELQQQVTQLIDAGKLPDYLRQRYQGGHGVSNSKSLYQYTLTLKNTHLKKSAPLSKVEYDDRIDVIHNALGLHTHISRVQGNKLRAKKEIRIASLFKQTPEPFLRMIVVHELAHIREKEHNRAFYNLCQYMEPDYHQLELDLRLYLTCLERFGPIY
ncbi:M48 family peptidase [Amphritea opalescens]|uniref:M48 family peptidase n=1 Tax=Amphritea opalescens TaxID=2490544 RepID=A0A430KQK0_9GAMM|nr:M48 family metallopeptidase [Amphritea opalescens]RTE65787.1 M48 family peptidase [Amphritea opalescens]